MHLPSQIVIPEGLHVNAIGLDQGGLIVYAQTTSPTARCPVCGHPGRRVHSHYTRTLSDLPLMGTPVRLLVTVRKFYCDNPLCARKVFSERLEGTARTLSRRTDRQHEALLEIAFTLGGEAGARLASQLGFGVSPDTLLRYIRRAPDCVAHEVRILGVDDWAWRRGQRYATILVDLELHRVVDLLEDRSSSSFGSWLERHQGVEVISRDRGGDYAEGARRGAPEAIQVADRFHLLKNLGEAVERILQGHTELLGRVPVPTAQERMSVVPRVEREAARQRTRMKTQARYKHIHALAEKGLSQRAIARVSGISRTTVRKHLGTEAVPQRPVTARGASILAPYEGYILERWKQGCRNAIGLWREIVELGYPGSHRNVSRYATYLRKQQAAGAPLESAPPGLTPRRALRLLLVRPERRRAEQTIAVEALRALHPDIQTASMLLDRFARLIRDRKQGSKQEMLEEWMLDAERSGLKEMREFARKLKQDLEAVLARLTLEYSQGQTEGQVLRLKLIRRQMYGRGKLDLLRKRVMRSLAA